MGRSTVRYEISAIRNESILAIKEFIDKRLEVDRNASKAFTPFTKFISTEEEIKSVHQPFAPDLELANLAIEFQDLQDCVDIPKDNLTRVVLLYNKVKSTNRSSCQRQTVSDR